MVSRPSGSAIGKTLVLTLGALSAGAVNGLLGTGAGTVLYFLYRRAKKGADGGGAKECFCAAMTAVLPLSLLSALTYSREAADGTGLLLPLIVPAALGGLLGAAISERARPDALRLAFSLIVTFGGVYMLFG